MENLIYGKNPTTRIVSIEPSGDKCVIFRELEDGSIVTETVPNTYYILFSEQHSEKFKHLEGGQHYRWLYETDSFKKYREILKASYERRYDLHVIRDPKEAFMVRNGHTYFKGMKPSEVSVLSFDLEHTFGVGMNLRKNGELLLISSLFRKNGHIEKRLFSLDEFGSEVEMLKAWCDWVREKNPSIMLGHNIFMHDMKILKHVADKHSIELNLGRDGSDVKYADRISVKRKDGSQSYDYLNCWVYGRELVDTYFLALDYDIGRNYESYGLKQIIKQEGLEKEGRTFIDASKMAEMWRNPEMRTKIKEYALDDVEDALKLFDLMVPARFYYAMSIPRSFQHIVNTATGSQLNSLMVRAYLQDGKSIAKGSEAAEYEGAISFGIPGIHKNVMRIDVASLYPSIIRQYKIYCREKDPEALFSKIVEYFTLERLKNKKLGKETGDRYYKDLEQAQKIVINSLYGFLGAPKTNYNYPRGAAEVTRRGREILLSTISLLTGRGMDDIQSEIGRGGHGRPGDKETQ